MDGVKDQLRSIIQKALRLPADGRSSLRDDQPLIGGELEIDSIDILQLILEIERQFGIKLVTEKFETEEWASIDCLAAAVQAKLAEAGR